MAAVELSEWKEVERSDEESRPSCHSDRMENQIGCGIRAIEKEERGPAKKEWFSKDEHLVGRRNFTDRRTGDSDHHKKQGWNKPGQRSGDPDIEEARISGIRWSSRSTHRGLNGETESEQPG